MMSSTRQEKKHKVCNYSQHQQRERVDRNHDNEVVFYGPEEFVLTARTHLAAASDILQFCCVLLEFMVQCWEKGRGASNVIKFYVLAFCVVYKQAGLGCFSESCNFTLITSWTGVWGKLRKNQNERRENFPMHKEECWDACMNIKYLENLAEKQAAYKRV